jgi:hypothetical protein
MLVLSAGPRFLAIIAPPETALPSSFSSRSPFPSIPGGRGGLVFGSVPALLRRSVRAVLAEVQRPKAGPRRSLLATGLLPYTPAPNRPSSCCPPS